MKLVNRKSARKVTFAVWAKASNESGLSKTLFPAQNYFYRRDISNVTLYRDHLGNNLAVLVCHLQVQVKNWHVVTYVPGQHGPNNRSKLSEYGLQLAENKTSFLLRTW